jgi:hypothetical protein
MPETVKVGSLKNPSVFIGIIVYNNYKTTSILKKMVPWMYDEKVMYKGKLYTVIFKYSSGYWEIKAQDGLYNVELVHESEVQKVTE